MDPRLFVLLLCIVITELAVIVVLHTFFSFRLVEELNASFQVLDSRLVDLVNSFPTWPIEDAGSP